MTFQGELKRLKKLPESIFPRNYKDHTIIVVTTTKMDILVNNQNNFKTPHHSPANGIYSCRPEAQKLKPVATAKSATETKPDYGE